MAVAKSSLVLFVAFFLLFDAASFVSSSESCSGLVVINNATFGTLQDHKGGGNYTRPMSCYWVINSPLDQQNNQITLVFDYFDSFGDPAIQRFDNLDIRDGSLYTPDLVWFYGYDQKLAAIVSSGSSLSLLWRVLSSSYPTGLGFKLQYSSSSCIAQCNWKNGQGYCFNGQCYCSGGWTGPACDVAYCANNCGGPELGTCQNGKCQCQPGYYGGDCSEPMCDQLTVFTAPSIANFSDHHPGFQGTNSAYHATNCSWLIQPEGANTITLQFSAFDLEQNWDFLDIYDGDSTNSRIARRYTGSSIPPKFTSSGGSLFLHYYTDTGVDSDGFTASYTANYISAQPSVSKAPSNPISESPSGSLPGISSSTPSSSVPISARPTKSQSTEPVTKSHEGLMMFGGIIIGTVIAVAAMIGYRKWKEHQEANSGPKFQAVSQDEVEVEF